VKMKRAVAGCRTHIYTHMYIYIYRERYICRFLSLDSYDRTREDVGEDEEGRGRVQDALRVRGDIICQLRTIDAFLEKKNQKTSVRFSRFYLKVPCAPK